MNYSKNYPKCLTPGGCCFRDDDGLCTVLNDARFKGGCRFRKLYPDGKNQYDLTHGQGNGRTSDEEKDMIVQLYEKGLSFAVIADMLGRSEAGVQKVIYRKIKEGTLERRKTKADLIREMLDEGRSVKQIVMLTGFSRSHVIYVNKKKKEGTG